MRRLLLGCLVILTVITSGCSGPGGPVPGKNTPPVVQFSCTGKPVANEPVTFDGANATDDKGISSYAWNFGDNSSGKGRKVSHIFTQMGTYSVVLSCTDSEGATGTYSQVLQIKAEAIIVSANATRYEEGIIIKTYHADIKVMVKNEGGQKNSGAIRVMAQSFDRDGWIIDSDDQYNNETLGMDATLLFSLRIDAQADWTGMSFRASLYLNKTLVEKKDFRGS